MEPSTNVGRGFIKNFPYETASKVTSQGPCHECKSSDAFTNYADGHAHCYSCGYHRGPDGTSILRALKHQQGEINLPSDCDPYIPSEPQAWLNKYTLTAPEMRQNRIVWSEKKQSLIFPLHLGGKLELYQARYFGDDPNHPKWKTVGNKTLLYVPDRHPKDKRLVLVEDLISAIKVSRITNAAPLFGTSLSELLIALIREQYKEVITWFDPDAQLKAVKASLALAECGLKTRTIFSDKDPKDYWTGYIKQVLEERDE